MDNKILNLTNNLSNIKINNITNFQDKTTDKDIAKSNRLKKLCEDFESILIYHLIKEAVKTIPQNQGILNKSFAEKIYEDMLYQEYAKIIAHNTRLGIAENIYNYLSKYIK